MAAKDLRIVSDADMETEQFQDAHRILSNAKRIYFLGFGFHPDNVRRLGFFNEEWTVERETSVQVSGTTLGISKKDWNKIQTDILNGHCSAGTFNGSIPNFLRQSAPLD